MTDTPSTPRVLGVDFSYARPSVAQIKALGAHWVGRYLSTDPGKGLSKAELDEYLAAGLDVVLFYETTATRALQGFTAGHNDGHTAAMLRASLGIPASVPIYFTADTDTSWSAVEPYFSGAEQAVGVNRAGVYGGYQVVQGAANAGFRYLCQTTAWSHGQWCPKALIRQEGQLMHGQLDQDFGMAVDFGQYPNPTTSEDDVPLTHADAQLFAQTLLATTLPSPFRTGPDGKPQQIPVSSYLEWMDAHYDNTQKAVAGVLAAVHALAAHVDKLVPGAAAHVAESAAVAMTGLPPLDNPADTAAADAADTSAEPAPADVQSV